MDYRLDKSALDGRAYYILIDKEQNSINLMLTDTGSWAMFSKPARREPDEYLDEILGYIRFEFQRLGIGE